jgi:hypothetical protein
VHLLVSSDRSDSLVVVDLVEVAQVEHRQDVEAYYYYY